MSLPSLKMRGALLSVFVFCFLQSAMADHTATRTPTFTRTPSPSHSSSPSAVESGKVAPGPYKQNFPFSHCDDPVVDLTEIDNYALQSHSYLFDYQFNQDFSVLLTVTGYDNPEQCGYKTDPDYEVAFQGIGGQAMNENEIISMKSATVRAFTPQGVTTLTTACPCLTAGLEIGVPLETAELACGDTCPMFDSLVKSVDVGSEMYYFINVKSNRWIEVTEPTKDVDMVMQEEQLNFVRLSSSRTVSPSRAPSRSRDDRPTPSPSPAGPCCGTWTQNFPALMCSPDDGMMRVAKFYDYSNGGDSFFTEMHLTQFQSEFTCGIGYNPSYVIHFVGAGNTWKKSQRRPAFGPHHVIQSVRYNSMDIKFTNWRAAKEANDRDTGCLCNMTGIEEDKHILGVQKTINFADCEPGTCKMFIDYSVSRFESAFEVDHSTLQISDARKDWYDLHDAEVREYARHKYLDGEEPFSGEHGHEHDDVDVSAD